MNMIWGKRLKGSARSESVYSLWLTLLSCRLGIDDSDFGISTRIAQSEILCRLVCRKCISRADLESRA